MSYAIHEKNKLPILKKSQKMAKEQIFWDQKTRL
jgi:hypothetical protein